MLGLAPLTLAVTGVSTWLVRRKARRQRLARQAGPAQRPSAPTTSSTDEAVSDADTMSPTLVSVIMAYSAIVAILAAVTVLRGRVFRPFRGGFAGWKVGVGKPKAAADREPRISKDRT